MKLFFILVLILFFINCQDNIDENVLKNLKDYKFEFDECIKNHGINVDNKEIDNKIKNNDLVITNTLNSFRERMKVKADQDILKECRKKILDKFAKDIKNKDSTK